MCGEAGAQQISMGQGLASQRSCMREDESPLTVSQMKNQGKGPDYKHPNPIFQRRKTKRANAFLSLMTLAVTPPKA